MVRMTTEVSREVYQAFVGVPTVRDNPLVEVVFLSIPLRYTSVVEIANREEIRQPSDLPRRKSSGINHHQKSLEASRALG